ncbi:MAG: hypothetical protein HY731_10760 [Candidatus Tectomicrobia bacterium]|nr:hypothetical protein [Candidatus Tectomicrobia bacterium]
MLRAKSVVDALKGCGISHVVWLPDSESKFMYDALHEEQALNLVPVCREGEAFSLAAGLYMGGKEPVVLIQNTGMFESGDVIRGTTLALHFPLVMMIGYRGYVGMKEGRKPVDTAGLYTEPYLKMFGIPYHIVEDDDDIGNISRAYAEARETSGPVAVLIGVEYD